MSALRETITIAELEVQLSLSGWTKDAGGEWWRPAGAPAPVTPRSWVAWAEGWEEMPEAPPEAPDATALRLLQFAAYAALLAAAFVLGLAFGVGA